MHRTARNGSSNCSRLAVALAVHGMLASGAALATTYYVGPGGSNSNSGLSTGSPFATIAKAVSMMSAGDTTIVMDGVFVESMITFNVSGTSSLPITLKAENQHQAVLSSTSGCQPAISLLASHIVIEDLKIQVDDSNVDCAGDPTSSNGAIRAWGGGSSYVVPTPTDPSTPFSHCVMRGLWIVASPERDVGIKSNQDYCLVENSRIESSLEALGNIGNVFRNNLITGTDAWGTMVFTKGGARNTEIYNNVLRVPAVAGKIPQAIILGGETGRPWIFDSVAPFEAYNSVAYNNVIINESGGNIYAIGMMGATGSAIFNNVVVGPGWLFLRNGYNPGGGLPVAQSTDPIIRNNIFSCGGGNALATGSYWTYSGTLTLDNNNFYNCVSAPSQTNAVTGDPLLVNTTSDWHVQAGSPAIGSGHAIPSFTGYNSEIISTNRDKAGVLRTTPWDVGVYAIDSDADGVPDSTDNCDTTANAAQTDIDANSVGDACQHGLTATYFNDTDTNSSGFISHLDDKLVPPAVLQRIESNLHFNHAFASPASGIVNADHFSARWTGRLVAPAYSGNYEICLKGDDGYRLWIDGVERFEDDHWLPQDSVEECVTIALSAGQSVPIVVEYFDLTEDAILELTWSYPGQSKIAIPNSALYAE